VQFAVFAFYKNDRALRVTPDILKNAVVYCEIWHVYRAVALRHFLVMLMWF